MELLASYQSNAILLFTFSVIRITYGFAVERLWVRDTTFDHKLPSFGLPFVSRSRTHCGKTCLDNVSCLSFFFAPGQNFSCHLLDQILTSVSGLTDISEGTYYILNAGSSTSSSTISTSTTTATTTSSITSATTLSTNTPNTSTSTITPPITTPAMTTVATTTSSTTTPSATTAASTTQISTTSPTKTTSTIPTATTTVPFSCPPLESGFTTVQLEDSSYFTYKVMTVLQTKTGAMDTCKGHGSFLARVTTVAKMNMLLNLIRNCHGYSGVYDYYVDGSNAQASDFFAPGAWSMNNGDPVPMSNDFWGALKPNYPGTQHCLRMTEDINYMWDDCSCSATHYFICEK